MNWRGILGIVFVCTGAALTIIAMATLEWRGVATQDNKTTFGLVNMVYCEDSGVCTTQPIQKLLDDNPSNIFLQNIKKAGQQVIGCGVCSLVMWAVGFLCMYFAYKWSVETHQT